MEGCIVRVRHFRIGSDPKPGRPLLLVKAFGPDAIVVALSTEDHPSFPTVPLNPPGAAADGRSLQLLRELQLPRGKGQAFIKLHNVATININNLHLAGRLTWEGDGDKYVDETQLQMRLCTLFQ